MPIFVLKSRVPHIEPPSERSKAIANKLTEERALPKHSKKVIASIKRSSGEEPSTSSEKKKRKHRGKNPLSCLKKKRKATHVHVEEASSTTNQSKRRKRHKNKNSEDIMTLIKSVAGS